MNILLAGCGKLGQRLGHQLSVQGHRVIGIKRTPVNTTTFELLNIDLSDKTLFSLLPKTIDIIVFTVTPSVYSAAGYRHIYQSVLHNVIAFCQTLTKPPLLLMVSSTSVYGQHNGEWVDEDSPTAPVRYNGQWVLAGEKYLQQALVKTLVVRFSGIYGNRRQGLIKRAISGEALQKEPPLWTNRIHEDDCVGVLAFVIDCYRRGVALLPCYLASDDMPVSSYDVCTFIAEQLQRPLPPVKKTALSQQLHKRCDNRRIKSLGYCFKFPDFRAGYRSLIREMTE